MDGIHCLSEVNAGLLMTFCLYTLFFFKYCTCDNVHDQLFYTHE